MWHTKATIKVLLDPNRLTLMKSIKHFNITCTASRTVLLWIRTMQPTSFSSKASTGQKVNEFVMHCYIAILLHFSPAFLYGISYYYQGGHPFAFTTALILNGTDSARSWKPWEILLRIDMIVSCSWTSMMWISHFTTFQRYPVGLRSGECWGHLSTAVLKKTKQKQFQHNIAGSSSQRVATLWS